MIAAGLFTVAVFAMLILAGGCAGSSDGGMIMTRGATCSCFGPEDIDTQFSLLASKLPLCIDGRPEFLFLGLDQFPFFRLKQDPAGGGGRAPPGS